MQLKFREDPGIWKIDKKVDSTLKFSFEHDENDILIARRWKDITEYRIKEKDAVNTIEELELIFEPEIDEIRFVKNVNAYFQYKLWLKEWNDKETGELQQNKYMGWDYLSNGFQNAFFNYGRETEEEIKTEFSTLNGSTRSMTEQKEKLIPNFLH